MDSQVINSVVEWIFDGAVHPYQVLAIVAAIGIGKMFLESCYGKLGRQ